MSRNNVRGFGVYDGALIPAPGVVIDGIAVKPNLGAATEVSGGEVVPVLGDATEIDAGENEVVPTLGAGTEIEGGEVVPSPLGWRELRFADAVDQDTPTFDPNDLFFSANDGPSPDGNVLVIRLFVGADAPTDIPDKGVVWLWDITPAPGQRPDDTLDPFDGGRLELAVEIIDEDVSGRWIGTHQPVLLVGVMAGSLSEGGAEGRGQQAGFRRESDDSFRVATQSGTVSLQAPSAAATTGRCLHVGHLVYDARYGAMAARPYGRDGEPDVGVIRTREANTAAPGGKWRICLYAGHTGFDAGEPLNDLRVRIKYRVLPGADFPFSP